MKTFIALTVMGLAVLFGVFNKATVASIGMVPMLIGGAALIVVIVLYFKKTKAGSETQKDYTDGAKETKEAVEETAKAVAEKAGKVVDKARSAITRDEK